MISTLHKALLPIMEAGLQFNYQPKNEDNEENIVLCVKMPENSEDKKVELIVKLGVEPNIFRVFARWQTDYTADSIRFFEVDGFFTNCPVGENIYGDGSVLYVHGKDLSKALEFAVKPAVYSYTEAQFGMLEKLEVCFRRTDN